MQLDIIPLQSTHLEDAARLACRRYKDLRKQVPLLPSRYGEIDTLLPRLCEILDEGPAVAALEGNQLVGFMAAWQMASFRGRRATYSPEWANGALLAQSDRIYEAMYTYLSRIWVADSYGMHLVGSLVNDRAAVANWPWMGFGIIAADAVRDLSPLPEPDTPNMVIRRAGIEDLEAFMDLEGALARCLAEAPTFLLDAAPDTIAQVSALFEDGKKVIWLAIEGDRPVAYLLIGPASQGAAAIIFDEGTCSITGAYTRPSARGRGIGRALLNQALSWARAEGYTRCAVDFEPMNPPARRFWLSSFTPVCYTFARTIS